MYIVNWTCLGGVAQPRLTKVQCPLQHSSYTQNLGFAVMLHVHVDTQRYRYVIQLHTHVHYTSYIYMYSQLDRFGWRCTTQD